MWKIRDRLGLVGGSSGRFETCRGTLWEVRDGSRDPRGDPGRVEGPTGRSGTGRGTIGEIRGTFGEVRWNLWEVRGTLCEVRGTH